MSIIENFEEMNTIVTRKIQEYLSRADLKEGDAEIARAIKVQAYLSYNQSAPQTEFIKKIITVAILIAYFSYDPALSQLGYHIAASLIRGGRVIGLSDETPDIGLSSTVFTKAALDAVEFNLDAHNVNFEAGCSVFDPPSGVLILLNSYVEQSLNKKFQSDFQKKVKAIKKDLSRERTEVNISQLLTWENVSFEMDSLGGGGASSNIRVAWEASSNMPASRIRSSSSDEVRPALPVNSSLPLFNTRQHQEGQRSALPNQVY